MAAPARNPDVDGETIADELAEALPGGDRAARKVAGRLAGPAVDAAEVALHGAIVAVADATVAQRRARADLAAHDDLPADPPPPLRAGIPAVRTGVPIWLAVEFTDGIDGADAAMLEAALDAAGLLDAVVTETGLLALDSDDTLVGADEIAGRGIRDWLRPAEGSEVAVVERILASIGAGPDAGRACWADLDGTWGNGQLTGRWSKPTVEHVGAAARADAHARRRDQPCRHSGGSRRRARGRRNDTRGGSGRQGEGPRLVGGLPQRRRLGRRRTHPGDRHCRVRQG
jgi:hypothetical protein